jgi:hypothetical protein
MNTMTHLLSAGMIAASLAATTPAAAAPGDYELEPCINGKVSATGMYPTQAQEDAALKTERELAEETRDDTIASK